MYNEETVYSEQTVDARSAFHAGTGAAREAAQKLHVVLSDLVNRLEPVCRPDDEPAPPNEKQLATIPPHRSPLLREVYAIKDDVDSAVIRLNGLLSRLDV